MQDFIHKSIPSSKALGLEIRELTLAESQVYAPLSPNVNHMGTAFGGSIYSALVLSAYCWLYYLLHTENLTSRIVIQSATVEYKRPVTKDFLATCMAPPSEDKDQFLKGILNKSKSRLELTAVIREENHVCAQLKGIFVASYKPQ